MGIITKLRTASYGWLVAAGMMVLIIILAIIVVIGGSNDSQTTHTTNTTVQGEQNSLIGRIGSGYFNFEVVDTPESRAQGLSGRESLPITDAMLFVFETPGVQCFWMNDMKFPIDIMWFDENKTLVYEKRNVSPDTYPENFCPDVSAKYVAEVAAGVAEANQIKIGDTLEVEL